MAWQTLWRTNIYRRNTKLTQKHEKWKMVLLPINKHMYINVKNGIKGKRETMQGADGKAVREREMGGNKAYGKNKKQK